MGNAILGRRHSGARVNPGLARLFAFEASQVPYSLVDCRFRGNDRPALRSPQCEGCRELPDTGLHETNVPNEAVNLLKTNINDFPTGLKAVNLLKTSTLIY